MKEKKFSGYKIVIAMLVYMFVTGGSFGLISIFMTDICAQNNIALADLSILFTTNGVGGVITALFITPTLLKKIGPRKCMMIGYVFILACIIWYGAATTAIEFWIAAAVSGVGISLGLMAAFSAIVGNWFIEKRASMTSLVLAGNGLGKAAFQMIMGPVAVALGYHMCYYILAGLIAVIGVACILLVKDNPKSLGQEPLGYGKEMAAAAPGADVVVPGVTKAEAMKSPAFWLAFVAIFFGVLATYAQSYLAPLLQANGVEAATAATYSSIFNFLVFAMVTLSGRAAEKLGYAKYILIFGLMSIVGMLILGLGKAGVASSGVMVILAAALISAIMPKQTSDTPLTSMSYFGRKEFGTIQAQMAAAFNCATVFGGAIVSGILKMGLDLNAVYVVFAGFALISTVLFIAGYMLSPMKKQGIVVT